MNPQASALLSRTCFLPGEEAEAPLRAEVRLGARDSQGAVSPRAGNILCLFPDEKPVCSWWGIFTWSHGPGSEMRPPPPTPRPGPGFRTSSDAPASLYPGRGGSESPARWVPSAAVLGRPPQATAFLLSLLSKPAIPPLFSAVWFLLSTFAVSFEVAVKRPCVGQGSRMPKLSE